MGLFSKEMCLAVKSLQDAGSSPSCNNCCPSGVCVASPVRNEKDGGPENPEVIPAMGMSSSTRSRSYYCWYRRSRRKLCSRFRRSSAKVMPEMTEATEIDSIEAGSPQQDDVMGLEETTAPNSPASGCQQQEKTDQDRTAKAGGRRWLGRLLLLYSGKPKNTPIIRVRIYTYL